ncbi:hypothetical protein NQ317_000592 [Molorchus minor]|uniref:Reverse transcriptase domain-containing protein n=1 Tax=Molorchus minor TaxID=1323400 RepID=A0ABQ9IS82_9CUCU|nr:hypothetical protein NQ317_000592 [Molorchus minor]
MPPKMDEYDKVALLMNNAIDRLRRVRARANAAKIDDSLKPEFEARYEKVEEFYAEFTKQHYILVDLLEDSDDSEALTNILRETDDIYFEINTIYKQLFPKVSHVTTPVVKSNVKLPEISLRSFEGAARDWPPYFDLFKSLIDNNVKLSNTEKMHYLVSTLGKEPLALIKQLPIEENNYETALDLLKKRYQNNRLLATNYLNEILLCPAISVESAIGLRDILDKFSENLSALKCLQFNTDNWDFVLFNILLQKIDISTKTQFEKKFSNVDIPSYKDLVSFLTEQAKALESVMSYSLEDKSKSKKSNRCTINASSHTKSFIVKEDSKFENCRLCNSKHPLSSCTKFLSKTPQQRFEIVKQHNLCLNCLNGSHTVRHCRSRYRCKVCRFSHNSLLHFDSLTNQNTSSATSSNNLNSGSSNSTGNQNSNVLNSSSQISYAAQNTQFVDPGASTSEYSSNTNVLTALSSSRSRSLFLLSTGIVNFRDCRGNLQSAKIVVDGGSQASFVTESSSKTVMPKGVTNCTVSSVYDSNTQFCFEAIVLENITSHLPSCEFPTNNWPYLSNLQLADPSYNTPGPIDALLGLEIFSQMIKPGIIPGQNGGPTAINSSIGWLLTAENSLDNSLKRFWELEEVPEVKSLSVEEKVCEEIYINTDHIDKGYMEEVEPTSDSSCYYIPHSYVFRPDSLSTRLRVVMDASAKDAAGKSLNDCLYIGPKLQQDIFSLLLVFRSHPIIVTADIKKMYLQINVVEEHRDVQRIVWRSNSNEPVRDFRLNVVSFGVNSSPWLALRTMKQLAQEGKASHPRASKILENGLYMDDVCVGFATVSEALKAKAELIDLLGGAGFQLHKWCSNSLEVVEGNSTNQLPFSFEKNASTKILGMQFNTVTDVFFYKTSPLSDQCTKRTILSDLAKLFDPLGLLTPVIFLAKHLIQHLWTLGLDWDSKPPDDVINFWKKFKIDVSNISRLTIPRFLGISPGDKLEIHGFADASLKGFCACIYFRKISPNGDIDSSLICAKSKVSPLKTISLARLELCGAVLLSKLMKFVLDCYENIYKFSSIFAWTDSSVTLCWIKSSPHKYKTFVANRISMIQDRIAPEFWYHLKSDVNVADHGSRGMLPSDLLSCHQWWKGPDFFQEPEEQWPKSHINKQLVEETKKTILVVEISVNLLDTLLEKFSSLAKIVNIICYIKRFLQNAKNKNSKVGESITAREWHEALLLLVRHVQGVAFAEEILKIKANKICSKPLRKLNPFVDDNNILRVGGRLRNADLSYDAKHPALLPKNHRLTTLLVAYYHNKFFHPGAQALQCLIVQNFWIIAARKAISSVILKCCRCFRVNPKNITPIMVAFNHRTTCPAPVRNEDLHREEALQR